MWTIIDTLFILAILLILILPVYRSVKKANEPLLKAASISAIFAPLAVVINYIISLNLDVYIKYKVVMDNWDFRLCFGFVSIINLAVYAFFFYIFTRKHRNIIPKFLFFVIPGISMLWTFVSNSIQTIVVTAYANSKYFDIIQEMLQTCEGIVFTIARALIAYFIMKKLIYTALLNNGRYSKQEICETERQDAANLKKSASIIAIFSPAVILAYILLELFLEIYCIQAYGIEYESTYQYYLYMSIAALFALFICATLYLFLTRWFNYKFPTSLCLIAFGVSPVRTFLGGLLTVLPQNNTLANLVSILILIILAAVGYYITRNTLLKFMKNQ